MPTGVYARPASKYSPGTEHDTPYGRIRVLELLPRIQGKQQRCVIRFLSTGTVLNVQTCNLAQGKVCDRRVPTVYGVGYLGMETKLPARGHPLRKLYDLWANMLKRCYGPYKGRYPNASVDPRWHSFAVFVETVAGVPGFEDWESDTSWCLDKDTRVPGNRVYSLDTCVFLPAGQNVQDALKRRWAGSSDPGLT